MESTEQTAAIPPVEDLANDWGNALDESVKADSSLSVGGSQRKPRASSAVVAVEPIKPAITGTEIQPLVRALGAFACRVARVTPMTDDEAKAIAEPGAAVLSKWAPNVAAWVPEIHLATALSNFVSSRSDEFKRNNTPRKEADSEATAQFVEPEKF